MKVFYVFGESLSDTSALSELIAARAEAETKLAKTVPLRTPIIHQRSGNEKTRRTNAEKVAKVVAARLAIRDERPVIIVAHEDCDECEPAHQKVASRLESGLSGIGAVVIAAAPAFEMEAWWYLWPDAVGKVCPSWRRLGRKGSNVGLIVNAKETLRRELRPAAGPNVRDYSPADSRAIASYVRQLKLINTPAAKSDSFAEFDRKVRDNL